LGIDFGQKRIGLAVSDPTNTVATPLETLTRRPGKRAPLGRIAEIAESHDVAQLVVGLPLGLDGKENDWCAEVRAMAERLAAIVGAPVAWIDERLTSVRAERAIRGSGLPRSRREERGRVDAAAAQLILQMWLDNPEAAR
jgi:putative Holliday junction resolvase